jgi:hypothetical protein
MTKKEGNTKEEAHWPAKRKNPAPLAVNTRSPTTSGNPLGAPGGSSAAAVAVFLADAVMPGESVLDETLPARTGGREELLLLAVVAVVGVATLPSGDAFAVAAAAAAAAAETRVPDDAAPAEATVERGV